VPASRIRVGLVAIAAALGVGATGCAGGSRDRAGGVIAPRTVVLTLASHDTGAEVREWTQAVRQRSHGTLRVAVASGWRRRQVEYAGATIADVRAGRIDLASIPARAYDSIGVESFEGLLAPLAIDSYALQQRVLAGPLPTRALAGVASLGVQGVALLPGPLQHVLSVRNPLLEPSDYRPGEIGIHRSALASSTFRALGATTSELASGEVSSQLAGIETDLVDLMANRYNKITADETMASNVSFWPRLTSIVIDHEAFAALSRVQQQALVTAGRSALPAAMRRLAREERTALAALCRDADERGALAFLAATPAHLAGLRRALLPVSRTLERSAATRGVVGTIAALKRQVTATAAPDCPAGLLHRLHVAAPTTTMRLSLDLVATSRSTLAGTATSARWGRGRLLATIRFGFGFDRGFAQRVTRFVARFPAGTLRGCMAMTITRDRLGDFRWVGSRGAIKTATGALRRAAGLSLSFTGHTPAGDRRRLHGRLVSDVPTGVRC
jgi:TRAP-type C4-dicarboxylate transport system substrate-binding protein